MTGYASLYLLACEALSTTQERYAFSVFERTFQDFGLPEAIRTDNGVPFASAHALYGLSKLAVWWLRLGIRIERIAPGHPEQNGRHERMHLTLKTDATRPASPNVLHQQMRFDTFLHRYNHERPHQALDMATPATRYTPSARVYRGLEELDYRHARAAATLKGALDQIARISVATKQQRACRRALDRGKPAEKSSPGANVDDRSIRRARRTSHHRLSFSPLVRAVLDVATNRTCTRSTRESRTDRCSCGRSLRLLSYMIS